MSRTTASATRSASADDGSSQDIPDVTDTRRNLWDDGSSPDVPDVTDTRHRNLSSDDAPDITDARQRNLRPADDASSSEDIPDIIDTRHRNLSSDDAPDITDTRQRNLRPADDASSSEDIPDIVDTRHRNLSSDDAPDISETRSLTKEIPDKCMTSLVATAGPSQALPKDSYYLFTESMANGYFTANGMESYSDLPYKNKFGFVTLACQCEKRGDPPGCCQGERARIDVTVIDQPETMSRELTAYISDVCRVTDDAIGENRLEDTGEFPGSPGGSPGGSSGEKVEFPTPVNSPTTGEPTTMNPVVPTPTSTEGSNPVLDADGAGSTDKGGTTDNASTTLNAGAWVGIALGAAALLSLFMYLVYKRRQSKQGEHENLEEYSQHDANKELLAVEWPSRAAASAVLSMTASEPDTHDAGLSVMSDDLSSVQTGATGPSVPLTTEKVSMRSYRGYEKQG